MAADDEVRHASERFYAALNSMAKSARCFVLMSRECGNCAGTVHGQRPCADADW